MERRAAALGHFTHYLWQWSERHFQDGCRFIGVSLLVNVTGSAGAFIIHLYEVVRCAYDTKGQFAPKEQWVRTLVEEEETDTIADSAFGLLDVVSAKYDSGLNC